MWSQTALHITCSTHPEEGQKPLVFMDYRRLNGTKKDCFLPPRINNTLDTLARVKWLCTLDLKSGFCPEDKEKMVFSTGQGL
jgi:hypothetical protein